ncbi:MAG TPA: LptA/OstA family protein [Edaphobacter sp.]|jgi:lipopolysaccharide export system protein LptA|nr:LptA/OstA family protein [Edaphobacter sp.]
MNVSVERLRLGLLVGAGLLVMVVVAFLGYAHHRAHRFLKELPAKLGVDVRRESNNVTYSQSVEGRTVYTIHAAKEVERSDGKMTLHDVGIVLYGRKQDRADRIYGNEFEYDPKNQVIRAVGEVHIDLQAPQATDANAKMDYAAGKDLHKDATGSEHEATDERLIHVTTSGLVFLQKLGVAATDKDIEFESGGLTGHAVGADYSSDTGVVVLHSAVKVNGLQHERPVVLTATHAVLDRPGQTMVLSQAKYVVVGGKTEATEGETAQAQHVVVHLRRDGSAERVEGDGDVALTNGAGGRVSAPRGEVTLNLANQPMSAVMTGGVKYGADEPLRQAQGEAAEGHVAFDKKGHPDHVTMSGAVHLHERVRASDAANELWSERELNAGAVELALTTTPAGNAVLQDAKATGEARLKLVNAAAKGGTSNSTMSGDVLTAHFVRMGNADHLSEVHSDGHARIHRVSATGEMDTSSADSLVAHFRPAVAGAARATKSSGKSQQKADGFGGPGGDEVTDATMEGHVVLTELPVKKPGDAVAPSERKATAEKTFYDGDLERATLTGNVVINDGASVLWADRVVMEQQSGDATAEGSVKASYRQSGSSDDPAHVLAARAELKHDSQITTFHGVAGRPARLWQGGSQVEAPVIQFDQKQQRLQARGEGQGAPMSVHTVLVRATGTGSAEKADAAKTTSLGKIVGAGRSDVMRVVSRELVYSDETKKAEFTGGVEAESGDSRVRAQQIVVYLQAALKGSAGKAPAKTTAGDGMKITATNTGFMGGNLERMVLTGHLELEQPGRRATGEQLVYTAGDDLYVLTGTAAALPKVVDDQRGTLTGTSLRFHGGDDNVVVSNGGESGTKVHTETRVKNRQ